MSIKFPVLPAIPALPNLSSLVPAIPGVPNLPSIPSLAAGLPAVASFPGAASIVGSIQGQVLSVTSGFGSISAGLSLAGAGILPGTTLTSGLTAITGGIGIASVNLSQTVSNVAMQMTGSLDGLIDSASSILDGDSVSAVVSGSGGPPWGIYLADGGALVLAPDSFVAVSYKQDWHISDYPVEQGSFESYNKVRLPFESRVTMTKGGTEADRTDFLKTVETVAASLDLYDIVTPDAQYLNANVTHFDYERSERKGVSLLTVSIWLQEIRIEASSTFTQTAQPSGAAQVNGGTVQAQPATDAEVQEFQGHGATGSF